MKGIIEYKDTLIAADKVLFAEQNGGDVAVTIDGVDGEIEFEDSSLADFRDAWRRALTY